VLVVYPGFAKGTYRGFGRTDTSTLNIEQRILGPIITGKHLVVLVTFYNIGIVLVCSVSIVELMVRRAGWSPLLLGQLSHVGKRFGFQEGQARTTFKQCAFVLDQNFFVEPKESPVAALRTSFSD